MSVDRSGLIERAVDLTIQSAQSDWLFLSNVQGALLDAAEEFDLDLWPTPSRGPTATSEDPNLDARIDLGLELLRTIFERRLMVPGDVNQTFTAWSGGVDEWIERIADGWREAGNNLGIGDVAWFDLTPDGQMAAK